MTGPDRRAFMRGLALGGLGLGVLGACSSGSGELAGAPRPPAEGGIGGTGIVGVVTALGSIHVGGRRVVLPGDADVTDAFGAVASDAIRPGHSVTVEAATVAGALTARRVRVTHPLVGRLVVGPEGLLSVLGVPVRTEPGITVPAAGTIVAVSGLWQGTGVVASRLDPRPAGTLSAVAGEVSSGPGGLRLGGVPVRLAPGEMLEPGTFATVIGPWEDGRLLATRVEPGRFFGSAGPLVQLLVEGYLEPVEPAPFFAVSGLGHSFDPAAQLAAVAERRALFAGPYTGLFSVAHALPLPEDATARRALLATAGAPGVSDAYLSVR